jgi:hypothetical protein
VPLQSITAPTLNPLSETMCPLSTTTFLSGVFQRVFNFGVEAKKFSAASRNFSGRYGKTQARPIFTGAVSEIISANSFAKPSLIKFPAVVVKSAQRRQSTEAARAARGRIFIEQ